MSEASGTAPSDTAFRHAAGCPAAQRPQRPVNACAACVGLHRIPPPTPNSAHTSLAPSPVGACTQWEIYDEYIKDLERQRIDEAMKSKGGKKAAAAAAAAGAAHAAKNEHVPTLQSPTLMHSLGTLDRMVNQNMYEEVAMDFKYWDDASDAFR